MPSSSYCSTSSNSSYTLGVTAKSYAEDNSAYGISTITKKYIRTYTNNWAESTSSACSTCGHDYNYDYNNYYKLTDTTCIRDSWVHYDGGWTRSAPLPPVPLSDRFRQILQSRQAPTILLTRKPVGIAAEEREIRARETLRRMLGDDKYLRFLRNGFVSVQAKSGKVYQIYPGHGMTIVYDRGTPVEKLCVVLRGDFTPTDSLITRYVMILHDELHFKSLANVFQASPRPRNQPVIDTRNLPQIMRALKIAA
jgi:hypothetical protein